MPAHDLVFSLGPNCRNAWNARAHFGQTQAYPFDWWITPARAMLRMLEPDFAFTLSPEDLALTPVAADGQNSVYNRRLNILHHHDFPRSDKVVGALDPDRIAEVGRKYAFLFARFREHVAEARAPLALLNGIFGGWRPDPTGSASIDRALNGRPEPGALIAAIRDRLGSKTRVAIIRSGPASLAEFEGGVVITRPDSGARLPGGAAPSFAEPVHVFRECYAALGLPPAMPISPA